MTYQDLIDQIVDWSARDDVAAYIPSFIELSTSLFNNGQEGIAPIRCREMEEVATLTISGGAYALPSDYLQFRKVSRVSPNRAQLSYISDTVADQVYGERLSGDARDFTIVGSSLYAYPLTSSDIEMTYYKAIPNLSASNTTNWLLTKNPSLYLHSGLMMLGMFVKDNALMSRSATLVSSAIAGMNNASFADTYARASVRPKMQTP
jgi:hypothetical protein